MIQHLEVKHFKSLESIKLNGLGRINLLLGKNNTGKTALLEALFLLSLPSNPSDVLSRLYEVRGYEAETGSGEVWNSIFRNWDSSEDICFKAVELIDNKTLERLLRISAIKGAGRQTKAMSVLDSNEFASKVKGLTFHFESRDLAFKRTVTGLKRKPGQKQETSPGSKGDQPVTFLPARSIPASQEEARRFSQLEIANRHQGAVEILRVIEPRLKRLTVVATQMGSVLYGDLGAGRLIPVSLMGDGMLRTLSVALALTNSQRGLVLIDEVENGLHYSVLVGLWKTIAQTARVLEVQVFAATHSDECIQAVYEAMNTLEYQEDLRLYRFDLRGDITTVVDYTTQELSAAIASEQEVR